MARRAFKFLFDKSKDWTMEKAQVDEHKKSGDSAQSMSFQETEQKIDELSKQRNELDNELCPKSMLLPEEQDKALLVD